MQFSLKFIAAAAFLLPSLISGAALPTDSLAARDTTLTQRSPEFNALEFTRREAEASLDAAQVKREAYVQALEDYEEFTARSIEARGAAEEAAAQKIHDSYKTAQAAQGGYKKKYNNQKETWPNKLKFATEALGHATVERDGRQKFQDMLTSGKLDMTKPGRTAKDVKDQQSQLDAMKTCVATWSKRKSDAAAKIPNNTSSC